MSDEGKRPRRGVSPVLVGRADELGRLAAALSAPSCFVVVEGEAGIGKSRLVAEALTGADHDEADHGGRDGAGAAAVQFVGHCEMVQEPFLLGPVFDAIRRGTDRLPLPRRLNPVTGALAPFLPEIADRLPPALPVLGDPDVERHRLYRAVTALLESFGPAVLVLEDLHWAAPSTVEFVAFLAAHAPDRLRVVLTVRTEHHDQLPIWEALARGPLGPAVRIPLAPLQVGAVRELAERIVGGAELPASFVRSLSEKTGGIPFVVEEVLRTLADDPTVAGAGYHPDLLAGLAVPTALRDMLRQRLTSLDEQTQEILRAAAVIGMQPDEQLIGRVTGYDGLTVAGALGRGLAAGLMHEADGRSRFRHALVRQTVQEAVPAPVRRWLHLTVARELQAGPPPHPVAQLAHHFRQGGDDASFVRNAEAAADLAVANGDDATASRFLLQTLEVDLPMAERIRLARRLGPVAVHGLAQAAVVPVLQQLLADDRLERQARGELRFMVGRLLRQQGEVSRGYAEIERAVPDLVGDRPLLALALAILAVPQVSGPTLAEHLEHCAAAEALAGELDSVRVSVAVRIARSSLLLEIGDPAGWPLARTLWEDPAMPARPREIARASLNWAQEVLALGELERAESLLAMGRESIGQEQDLRLAAVVDLVTAEIDLAAGRWSGLADRLRRTAADLGDFAAAQLDVQFLLARLLARQGDPEDAEARLRAVIAASAARGAVHPLLPARVALARLLLAAGDPDGAVEQAGTGIDEARAKGIWIWGADSVLCLVDALESTGRLDLAVPVAAEFEERIAGTAAPAAAAAVLQWRAVLTRADGDHARASELLARAVDELDRLGLRDEAAVATARLGEWRCEQAAGGTADGDDGPALLERALRSFGAMDARGEIARVSRVMRGFGVPVPSPWRGGRRSYGDGLSPRELEVSRRAAAGRSNQQIAAELHLSTRTVESHIANALRKLGGRSRRELDELLSGLD